MNAVLLIFLEKSIFKQLGYRYLQRVRNREQLLHRHPKGLSGTLNFRQIGPGNPDLVGKGLLRHPLQLAVVLHLQSKLNISLRIVCLHTYHPI